MAFDTYTDLQAAVANWLHRTDLAAVIPDFILLAEKDFNRRLNVTGKETNYATTLNSTMQSVLLPADYATPVALWNEYNQPRWPVPFMVVAEMPKTTVMAMPCAWAIDGDTIVFDCPADQNYPLTLRYIQSLYLKYSVDGTSTMLSDYPDLYLYGTLAQSAPYMRDDTRLPMWQQQYEKILAAIKAEASRDKAAPLRTDIPRSTIRRNGFNINRGW